MRRTLQVPAKALLSLFMLSSAHRGPPRLAAIGDSTVAEYPSSEYPAVASLLNGVIATTLAVPGQTIAQQKAVWLAFEPKTDFDIIVVQIGLNDMSPDIPLKETVRQLQQLIDAVNHTKRPKAIIAIAQMNPARGRWATVYKDKIELVFTKWNELNRSIAGQGPMPIRGVDVRVGAHVRELSTPSGALKVEYDRLHDGIHPDAQARRVVACAWADALRNAGFDVTC